MEVYDFLEAPTSKRQLKWWVVHTLEMAESAYKYMGFPDKTKEMLAAKDFSAPVTKAERNAYEHAIKQTALELSPLSAPAGLDR